LGDIKTGAEGWRASLMMACQTNDGRSTQRGQHEQAKAADLTYTFS